MQNIDTSTVKEKVIDIVRRNAVLNTDMVNENSDIRRDHGIDSIKMVELVVDLEEEFDIEVDSCSLSFDNFANIERITSYVLKKIS